MLHEKQIAAIGQNSQTCGQKIKMGGEDAFEIDEDGLDL